VRTLKRKWKVTVALFLKDAVGLIFYVTFISALPDSAWKHDVTDLALLVFIVFIMANAIDAFVNDE
jgi:hypothetical protein